VIAQFGLSKGYEMYCADTDPANATFAGYKALQVEYINIANDQMQIKRDRFDDLVDNIAAHEGFSVIDTGSTSFFPLMSYAQEAKTFDLLKEEGVRVVVHAPVAGGSALKETLLALESLLENMNVDVVIWLNGHFGNIDLDGKMITETQLYKRNQNRILGVVNIAARERDTFGQDFESLLGKKLTFDEIFGQKIKLSQKQRFIEVRRELFEQLDAIAA
jgi:hypothetical protein